MRARRVMTAALAGTIVSALTSFPAAAQGQQEYELRSDDSWLLAEAPPPGSPEAELAQAQQALAEEQYERAWRLADAWIDEHERHELMPVALLTRADALFAEGDYYDALFDYEAIARLYPGSEVFITALQRELDIATKFARGLKRKFLGMRIVDASDEAEELLIRVQERLPGSALAEQAGLELGDFYYRRGEMSLAAEAYDLFLENYPKSAHVTTARLRLIAAHLAAFKGPEFDATGLLDARERMRELRQVDPVAAQQFNAEGVIAGIDEKLANQMLYTAKWYLRTGDPVSAEFVMRRLVRKYERSASAAEALRMIPDVLDRLAEHIRAQVAPFYLEKRRAILGLDDAMPPPDENESAPDENTRPRTSNETSEEDGP